MKEKRNKLDLQKFQKCNEAMQLDTISIANKLIGKWTLTLQNCSECSDPGTSIPKEIVEVEFVNSKEFVIIENSVIISQGTFSFNNSGLNNWKLVSNNNLSYLYGNIQFCENQVLFINSIVDGIDNLFERK